MTSELIVYLLHEILSQDGETLCVCFLRALALHQILEECLETLDVVEHGHGAQQEKVLLSQVGLIFLVDVALVSLSLHVADFAHEKGRLH